MNSKKHEESLPLMEREPNLPATTEPSVSRMLQIILDKPNPAEHVEVLERLIAMKERSDAKQAEREFAVAFHALQTETPKVEATVPVPDREGGVRYFFASYEHIMAQVQPLLVAHGFSVTFDSEFKEDRMVMRCTLLHVGGHSRTTTQFMRVGKVYGANDAQNDGATATMAKRYALCSALNIVIGHDTDGRGDGDARNEGEPIDFTKVTTLKEMVKESGRTDAQFLKFAGVSKYEEIGSKRYPVLFRELQDRIANK